MKWTQFQNDISAIPSGCALTFTLQDAIEAAECTLKEPGGIVTETILTAYLNLVAEMYFVTYTVDNFRRTVTFKRSISYE